MHSERVVLERAPGGFNPPPHVEEILLEAGEVGAVGPQGVAPVLRAPTLLVAKRRGPHLLGQLVEPREDLGRGERPREKLLVALALDPTEIRRSLPDGLRAAVKQGKADLAPILAELAANRQGYLELKQAAHEPIEAPQIVLAIAPATPSSLIIYVLGALQQKLKVKRVFFEVAASGGLAPPPEAPVLKGVSVQVDPLGYAAQLYKGCKPMTDAIDAIARIRPPDATELLAVHFRESRNECACDVDLGALRSLFWSLSGRAKSPPGTTFSVVLDPKGAPLELAPDATWDKVWLDVSARAKDGKPVAFRLRKRLPATE